MVLTKDILKRSEIMTAHLLKIGIAPNYVDILVERWLETITICSDFDKPMSISEIKQDAVELINSVLYDTLN